MTELDDLPGQEPLFRDELGDDFGTESYFGNVPGSISYVNEAGLSSAELNDLKNNREIASAIETWSQQMHQESSAPSLSMFNRGRYAPSHSRSPFALMAQCGWAVENDDVLATLADVVEGVMFQKMRFELYDQDQQDFWNQWAGLVNLDAQMRKLSRELFKYSQFYVGLWWEQKAFKVRDQEVESVLEQEEERRIEVEARREGRTPPETPSRRGNRSRRKVFSVNVPTGVTVFDPTKVVPVGNTMFGRERLAYVADDDEMQGFSAALAGTVIDPMVMQLIERKYTPTEQDKTFCASVGVDPNRLFLFKKDAVFRHTLTRADYERLAPVRLKSILPILEMKEHLRNADRASLIGATNFIIVITKGTDKHPARAREIENLQEQARVIARLPVLVGDHRLAVTIVAPPLDNTLIESRWQVLDSRLVFKALNTFSPVVQGGNSSGTGLSEMAKIISRNLESRRHMIVRALESAIFARMLEANEGILDEDPSMVFAPKRITLDFNAEVLAQILKLRDRGDISRETTLEEVDYDQDVEVVRRARERTTHDPVFMSQTPHSSPLSNPFQPQPTVTPPIQPVQGVGPAGQPREGGRPVGARDSRPRTSTAAEEVTQTSEADDLIGDEGGTDA